MFGTGDVVRRIPDDDELLWFKLDAEMLPDSICRKLRQITAIVRFVAESARQVEERAAEIRRKNEAEAAAK